MTSRDLSNKRVQMWLGPASALSSYEYATADELAAMLMAAPAIRWDGLDWGVQASQQEDDRSLDDDATATIRGFMEFGGGIPFFFPRVEDQSSIVRQVFDLVKVRGTELAIVTRTGWVDRRVAGAAGDNINIYRALTDGFMPDTEGTGGYAYLVNPLPQGDVAAWTIVADDPAADVEITGGDITAAPGTLHLRRATYLGNDITRRATWTSDDESVARVVDGIIEIVGEDAETCEIVASFPGGVTSDPIEVTVAA